MEFEYFCFLQQSRARIRTVNCPFSSGQIKVRIGTVNCPYSTGAPRTPGVRGGAASSSSLRFFDTKKRTEPASFLAY